MNLATWIAAGPESNQENQAKYQQMNSEIQELAEKLSKY